MLNIRIVAGLLCLGSPGLASTIATAGCGGQTSDTETITATCHFGGASPTGASSYAVATATAGYNSLSAGADSMWCIGPGPGDPNCQPDGGSSASFTQTALFTGASGNGSLVFSNITGYALVGTLWTGTAYFQSTRLFSTSSGQGIPQPQIITIPIVFGTPVTITGSVSAFATDSDGFPGIYPDMAVLTIGAFTVLDANGNTVQSFSGVAPLDSAFYNVETGIVSSPEPRLLWIVGIALVAIAARSLRRPRCI